FSAMSSPSTPAVFLLAALVSKATSSSTLAMSSSKANRLAPAIAFLVCFQSDYSNAARAIRRKMLHMVLRAFHPPGWTDLSQTAHLHQAIRTQYARWPTGHA